MVFLEGILTHVLVVPRQRHGVRGQLPHCMTEAQQVIDGVTTTQFENWQLSGEFRHGLYTVQIKKHVTGPTFPQFFKRYGALFHFCHCDDAITRDRNGDFDRRFALVAMVGSLDVDSNVCRCHDGSKRSDCLDPGGEVVTLFKVEHDALALVEDHKGAVDGIESDQGDGKYSDKGKQQLESNFHNVPQDRRERKSYPEGGRAVLVDSGIAIQFFARRGASKFGSELLAGLGGHNDEICRRGKLPCELQRIVLRLSSRLRNATNFFQRHIRNGKSSSNSVRRLAFQWNEVHQLFEADVNVHAVKLFVHARQRWIIVIIKRGDGAYGAELLPKAMELWRQMCRIEGRHSDSVALPSTRFPAGDQQGDGGSKECRDSRRPSSRRWVGDELTKWGREYRSDRYHDGYRANRHSPAAPVEPFPNRFVHRGFLPSWWVGASYSTQWRLSA
nr:MAG TPA: hypothetical protein [Caudoviricetes sp.]